MPDQRRHLFELGGWLLFVVSAVFFCIASWRAGDHVALAGSGLFLGGCFVFLVPLTRNMPAGWQKVVGRLPAAATAATTAAAGKAAAAAARRA